MKREPVREREAPPTSCDVPAPWHRTHFGGEAFSLYKSELRFPAFGEFDPGVFLEAGNLWLNAAKYRPGKLRYVAGAGVRYGTPIGPIAFDLGVNLAPDVEIKEPRANLHFSIGLF